MVLSTEIKMNRLYGDLAELWPLVSPPEDYREEASDWRDVLRDRLGPGRHRILELGVGGGHNLSHLTADFDAVAVDLSEGMLAHSRRLNPTVEHHVGDMRTTRLDRVFDAVVAHDAISYMLTEDDLRAVLATASVHLPAGGVFVAAPDYFKETFQDGLVSQCEHGTADRHLTFFEYDFDPDPTDTSFESLLTFLIRERGQLRIEHDRHILGLFPRATWLRLFNECGFDPELRESSEGVDQRQPHLIIGVKR